MERKVLFGVDDPDSAREAIAVAGNILQTWEDVRVTILYCAPDPNVSFLSRLLHRASGTADEDAGACSVEEENLLKRARRALLESGFDRDKVTMVCEGKCADPAESMLNMAVSEEFESILLVRRKASRLERLVGPTTYRLVNLSVMRPIWVIDPPIPSRNVLVALVGGPIGQRVAAYAVRYFSHLTDSKFTFFHVIPPLPPQYWDHGHELTEQKLDEKREKIDRWMKDYEDRVRDFAQEGRERLIEAGVPKENVAFKAKTMKRDMALNILSEMEDGGYGILVIGRIGSKKITEFRLGSIASKLLHNAQSCIICLVN